MSNSGINRPMDAVMGVSMTPIGMSITVCVGWGIAVAISVGGIAVAIGWIPVAIPITVIRIAVPVTVIWCGQRRTDERTCGKAKTDAAPSPTTVPPAPSGISWNR
jgi:hypothetical protein